MRFLQSFRQVAERKRKSDKQDEQNVFHTKGFYSKATGKSTWATKRPKSTICEFCASLWSNLRCLENKLRLSYVPSLLKPPVD